MKKFEIACSECNAMFCFETSKESYDNWKNGEMIQKAMPGLSSSERELLISGMCGDCFDKLIGNVQYAEY